MSREWEIGAVTRAEKAEERIVRMEDAILNVFNEVGIDVTAESQTQALLDLYALIEKKTA